MNLNLSFFIPKLISLVFSPWFCFLFSPKENRPEWAHSQWETSHHTRATKLGQIWANMISRHISIRRFPLEKKKPGWQTRNVLSTLLAAYTLKLESRSSEGHPQLLKLTPLSNTWCYNLIHENNYQKYPSNTKKIKSVQPTTVRDTSNEFHSEANPFDLMPYLPFLSPCSVLQPLYYQQSQSWCMPMALFIQSLLREMQSTRFRTGGTTETKLSFWEGKKMLNIVVIQVTK